MKKKSIIFSGIQATGQLNIGHYISVLSLLNKNIDKFNYFICIADLHAQTNKNIYNIKDNILNILSLFLSINIKFNKSLIFLQSFVEEHLKLFWFLSTMINFKKILKLHKYRNIINDNFNVGKLNYPILMASDILLYRVENILVGIDQKKNIEFIKYLIKKINFIYKNTFLEIKNCFINNKYCIMSLLKPNKKMSKSDINKNNSIFILDDKYTIDYKINRSLTDSDNPALIKYDIKNKPGISNLLNIVSSLENININDIENEFINKSYSEFKKYVSNVIYKKFIYIRKKFYNIRKDETMLNKLIHKNNKIAKNIAKKSFNKIIKNVYSIL